MQALVHLTQLEIIIKEYIDILCHSNVCIILYNKSSGYQMD